MNEGDDVLHVNVDGSGGLDPDHEQTDALLSAGVSSS